MENVFELRAVEKVAAAFVTMEESPSVAITRTLYTELINQYPTLMTILYSVSDEVLKPFPSTRRGQDTFAHVNGLPQALGDVLFAVSNGGKPKAAEVMRYDMNVKVILDFVCSHKIQTVAGVAWTASIIPELLGLPKLVNEYVILPDFIKRVDLEVQNIQAAKDVGEIKYPAYLFKADSKGKGKLCYFIRDGETQQSNIPYRSVRRLLSEDINLPTFGVIGYISKHKQHINFYPLCASIYTSTIKKLYQGKGNTYGELDLDMKEMFKRVKSTTLIRIKVPKLQVINTREEFHDSIKSWTKRRVQALVSPAVGTLMINIRRRARRALIVDFMLDDNYLPIGVLIKYKDTILKVRCKVPDDVIQNGIVDTFAEVHIESVHDKILRATLIRFMDSTFHSCVACGVATTQDFCSPCYRNVSAVISGTLENTLEFTGHKVAKDFVVQVNDYTVSGSGDTISFSRNIAEWKGQRGLPLFPASFGLQVVG